MEVAVSQTLHYQSQTSKKRHFYHIYSKKEFYSFFPFLSFFFALLSLHSSASLSNSSLDSDKTKNYIIIKNGKFNLVLIVSALHAIISADFVTWGALLSLNPDLIRFIYIFKNSISSSQANFMKVLEKVKDENAEADEQDKEEEEDDGNDSKLAVDPSSSSSSSSTNDVSAQKTRYGITADVKLSVFNYSMVLSKLTKEQGKTTSVTPLGLQLKYKGNNFSSGSASTTALPCEEEFKVDFPSLFVCTHYTFHPVTVDSPIFESVVNGAVSIGDCNISAPPFVASIACDFIDKILNHEDFLTPSADTKPTHENQQQPKIDQKKAESAVEKSEEKSLISGTFSLAVGAFDVKLLCVPICEVVCYLKTEPISCFVSFSRNESIITSVTAALPSASLKLHHMQFPDQNTSLHLNKIIAGYSSSRRPFHAILASADSFVINFE